MTVTPHDTNTYLVTSRTRPDVSHLVDLSTHPAKCGCEHVLDFNGTHCAHIEAAIMHKAGVKPFISHTGSILCLTLRKKK